MELIDHDLLFADESTLLFPPPRIQTAKTQTSLSTSEGDMRHSLDLT